MSEEDNAVKETVVQDTTTESAPVESNAPELTDPINWDDDQPTPKEADKSEPAKEEVKTESTEETEAEADVTPADSEETSTEEQQVEEEKLSPKSENRFQKLANENKQLREQLSQLNSIEAQITTEQDLLNQVNPETGDFYTVAEAERLARFQTNEARQGELAQERYELQVQTNQSIINNEAEQVITQYPQFSRFLPGTEKVDPQTGQLTGAPNPKYNAAQANQAATLMEQVLIRDPNTPEIDPFTGQPTGKGMVIGSHLSPLQVYESIANAAQSSIVEGQIRGQKATEKMMANADSVGSAAPPKTNKDPLVTLWEED